ncbi:MAG: hypothetical protein ACI4R9_01805 [Kiritimatiellia bacterium]
MMQRTCWEIRREAWSILWKGRWFWRLVGVSLLLGLVGTMANLALSAAYERLQIVHWGEYLTGYLTARFGTELLAVPSRETAIRMSIATGAAIFLGWVFDGCARFGGTVVLLRAARGAQEKWMEGIWRGFRTPFTHLALMLIPILAMVAVCAAVVFVLVLAMGGRGLHDLRTLAMMLVLLQIPACITWHYFLPLWLVRAEHLDWSAWACLRESRRLMKGHRYALLRLLQSYWALPSATLVVLLAIRFPTLFSYVLPILVQGALPFYIIVLWHMRMGVAVFWRDRLKADA